MNGRSGLVTFFIFTLLLVIIVLQFLSLIQANRLNERLKYFLEMQKTVVPAEDKNKNY